MLSIRKEGIGTGKTVDKAGKHSLQLTRGTL